MLLRAVVVLLLVGGFAHPAAPPIQVEYDVRIAMRDGVELSANVFLPANAAHLPALLVRTPYNKDALKLPMYRGLVEQGYAVVVEDVRGRYASEGLFDPLRQEIADGEDTLTWIAHQPWSNRRVGMMGGSYLGIAQWKAALSGSPYLKAIFPVVAGCDEYFDRFYSYGGALKLGHRLEWMSENLRIPQYRPDFGGFVRHVPLRSADHAATGRVIDFFQKALDHPSYDAYWKSISTCEQIARVHVPVFLASGWYDNFAQSDLEAFQQVRAHGGISRIVIGPWPHNFSYPFSGVDYGPEAKLGLRQLQLEWFNYWLKRPDAGRDARAISTPPVKIFVMGANRWRDEAEWPLRRARPVALFLASRGRANSIAGDGRLARTAPRKAVADQFIYDPHNPVPTAGGAVCCNPKLLPWGPMDQRSIEQRPDVLVYTTPPLKKPVEVTGPVRVVLYVATSGPDTDFTAKLVDVFPDGRAINLTDGILRLRYRESLERPILATPGSVYGVTVDAGVTSNEFGKGHRIRVEISSSNFPRFDRNPNTGRRIADERELRRATQTVLHDRQHPSHVLLQIVSSPGEL